MNGRSLLVAIPIGLFLWLLVITMFRLQPAHGFGSTINIEHNAISIYLDEDEFPRITGAEVEKRLCSAMAIRAERNSEARPASAFLMTARVSHYEVYRRGHPNTLIAKFPANNCSTKEEEIHGKKE